MERRTKVLKFCDDETTEYAILSHRWVDSTEVDYEEMADLSKMDRQEQDEICGRLGYKKIVDTCKQAKKDGYNIRKPVRVRPLLSYHYLPLSSVKMLSRCIRMVH